MLISNLKYEKQSLNQEHITNNQQSSSSHLQKQEERFVYRIETRFCQSILPENKVDMRQMVQFKSNRKKKTKEQRE